MPLKFNVYYQVVMQVGNKSLKIILIKQMEEEKNVKYKI